MIVHRRYRPGHPWPACYTVTHGDKLPPTGGIPREISYELLAIWNAEKEAGAEMWANSSTTVTNCPTCRGVRS